MSKFTKEICQQWIINREKDPIINPLTNRKITKGKGVYIDLEDACKKMISSPKKNLDSPLSSKTTNKKPDRFLFFSGSKDTKPGEVVSGRKEQEHAENIDDYKELNHIKDWRKILSNFHVSPFIYKDVTYNSIEHGFQAQKIALVDKEKAKLFTLESNSELAKGDGFMAQKQRKMVILTNDLLEKWGQMNSQIMEELAIAKYNQCKEAAHVLKLTKNAELWHIVTRKGITRFSHLERIRNTLLQ